VQLERLGNLKKKKIHWPHWDSNPLLPAAAYCLSGSLSNSVLIMFLKKTVSCEPVGCSVHSHSLYLWDHSESCPAAYVDISLVISFPQDFRLRFPQDFRLRSCLNVSSHMPEHLFLVRFSTFWLYPVKLKDAMVKLRLNWNSESLRDCCTHNIVLLEHKSQFLCVIDSDVYQIPSIPAYKSVYCIRIGAERGHKQSVSKGCCDIVTPG
jgi:hypothetical protein